jgi:hypothetical protein
MTPALSQPSSLASGPDAAGNETGTASAEDPHSPGSRPLDQLTGLFIGIAAIAVPLTVVLADTLMPLHPVQTPSWTGSIIRRP